MNQGTFSIRRAGTLLYLSSKIRSLLFQVVFFFYYNYPLLSLSVLHWRRGHLTFNLGDPRPRHATFRPELKDLKLPSSPGLSAEDTN